jgi:hypothetical protein
MPDGQKVVQVPNIGNIAFPGTMDDASINQAIVSYRNATPTQFEQQNKVPSRLEAGNEEASKILSNAMLPTSISDIPKWGSRMLGQEPGQKPWWNSFKEAWSNPTERNIVGAVPVAGPISVSAADEPTLLGKAGVLAGAGLGGATAETALRIPGKLGALANKAKEGAVPLAQKYLNVGPELTERAIEKWQGKTADVEGKYQEKLSAAQRANEAAKQTALEKQQLQTEAMGHAKELSEHLPQLKEQEKAFAKSLYPEVEGTADASEMQGRLQNAIDSNIRGTDKPPTTLTRIVKELEPENPLAQASVFRGAGSQGRALRGGVNLSDLPEAARAKILQRLGPEERAGYEAPETGTGKSLSFEQMHGYYSELGEELSKDLSGDERSSVTAARAELLGEMRKMAESQGKLTQFTEAQKNWSKYENTFNKTWNDKRGVASPIAKALNAKNPVTGEMLPERVAKLLSKDENYKLAQQMLSRYQGGKPELLQLMKEKMDQAGGMPKTMKETALPERPAGPEAVDPQALKTQALHETAQGMRSMKGIRGALDLLAVLHFLTTGNPLSMAYPLMRRGMSYGLESEGAMGKLTQPSEAEMRMIKPTQVYMNKKAAALAAKKENTSQ